MRGVGRRKMKMSRVVMRSSWTDPMCLFGFIALLFNLLIPIRLSSQIWQRIDAVCALLFAGIAFIVKDQPMMTAIWPNKNEREKFEID